MRRLARNHLVSSGVEEVIGANLVPLVVVQHPLGLKTSDPDRDLLRGDVMGDVRPPLFGPIGRAHV